MFRLKTSFLDLFLLLLLCVAVMVNPKAEEEESPPEVSHFIVEVFWSDIRYDVDLWGKRVGVPNSECGFRAPILRNLRLHGDWTGHTAFRDEAEPEFVRETMTMDYLVPGTYAFALQGYRLEGPVTARVVVSSVTPYTVRYETEITVLPNQWHSICRMKIDEDGKVLEVRDDLPTRFGVPK